MKKVLLPLGVVAALMMTGCGSETTSDNDEATTIVFDSSGAYDMADYLLATADATRYYDEWSYYSLYDSEISRDLQYSNHVFVNDTNVTVLDYIGDTTSDVFVPEATKIVEENDGDITEIARHVDLNDIVTLDEGSFNQTYSSGTYTGTYKNKCVLKNHFDTKTLSPDEGTTEYTYSDVLELECLRTSNYTYTPTDGTSETRSEYDPSTIYLARGKGEAAKIDSDCEDENEDVHDDRTACTATYTEHSYLNLTDSHF